MSAPSVPVMRAIIAHNQIPIQQKYVLLAAEVHQTRDVKSLCSITGLSPLIVGEAVKTPYDLTNTDKKSDATPTEVFVEEFEKSIGRRPTFSERTRWRAVSLFLKARYTEPIVCRIIETFFKEKQRFGWKDQHSSALDLLMNRHAEIFKSLRG